MPRQVDHQQRRQEIIAATWSTLAEAGLEGTTMRAIAQRAGCTTGRLNHYFDSRDDILAAALGQVHRDAAQRMTRMLEDRPGPDPLRRVLLEALPLDDTRRTEWHVWLAFWDQAAINRGLRDENARRYRQWRDLVTRLVRARSGPARSRAQLHRSTDVLVALVDGLGLQAILDPDTMTDRRARQAIDTTLALLTLDGP